MMSFPLSRGQASGSGSRSRRSRSASRNVFDAASRRLAPHDSISRGSSGGVEGDPGAGEALRDLRDGASGLRRIEVDEHRLGHEYPRSAGCRHRVHPRAVEDRRGDHGPARLVVEEAPPEGDRVWQVEVEPAHTTVVDPVEAGVEAAADLDDGAPGMRGQEVLHVAVEHPCAEHRALQAASALPLREVVVRLDGLRHWTFSGSAMRAAAFAPAIPITALSPRPGRGLLRVGSRPGPTKNMPLTGGGPCQQSEVVSELPVGATGCAASPRRSSHSCARVSDTTAETERCDVRVSRERAG